MLKIDVWLLVKNITPRVKSSAEYRCLGIVRKYLQNTILTVNSSGGDHCLGAVKKMENTDVTYRVRIRRNPMFEY